MPKRTLTDRKYPPNLEEYVQRFGHRPSPEAFKFKTMGEIEEMAELALKRNQPIQQWQDRGEVKTGTILDNYPR